MPSFPSEIDYTFNDDEDQEACVKIKYTYAAGSPPRRYGHPDDWHDGDGPEIEILRVTSVSTGLKMPEPAFSDFLKSHEDSIVEKIIKHRSEPEES